MWRGRFALLSRHLPFCITGAMIVLDGVGSGSSRQVGPIRSTPVPQASASPQAAASVWGACADSILAVDDAVRRVFRDANSEAPRDRRPDG
ncbi:hypothetical protein C8Q74DRAFT_240513 [Fomes fomentarius]|nr:hypothetical protein C8Q74DRAFT_240513 [Fomes fomentarius]